MLRRRRRISMRVEHRQASLSITEDVATPGEFRPALAPQEAQPSAACPSCGAPWHLSLQNVLADGQIAPDLLQAAVLDRRLHVQQQLDGQVWICEESVRQIRETGE